MNVPCWTWALRNSTVQIIPLFMLLLLVTVFLLCPYFKLAGIAVVLHQWNMQEVKSLKPAEVKLDFVTVVKVDEDEDTTIWCWLPALMVWLTEHEPIVCIVISPIFIYSSPSPQRCREKGNQTIRKSENRAGGGGGAGERGASLNF